MAEYSARNASDRERLRRFASLGDGALTCDLAEGWTVGAALAHVAFWDRLVLARWRSGMAAGSLVEISREALVDFVNAANSAGLPQWLLLSPGHGAREALAAAEELDALVASLPDSAREQVRDSGLMVDRSPHRGPHLTEIEAALGLGL